MFFDAHNHLQDPRLDAVRDAALRDPTLAGMVVNGTSERDWAAVAALARAHPKIVPAYGLHPWEVDAAAPGWLETLRAHLDAGGVVGEIGLDRWKTAENFPRQLAVFRAQWDEAARRDVPATVHCLRAWGALRDEIAADPRPRRGWLLHAYGGPAEMVAGFVARGASFSFSGSFLNPGRERKLAAFRLIPLDRLLVETDAPAMPLARDLRRHPLGPEDDPAHDPRDLAVAYEGLAALRGLPVAELAGIVAGNYARLFEA